MTLLYNSKVVAIIVRNKYNGYKDLQDFYFAKLVSSSFDALYIPLEQSCRKKSPPRIESSKH